MPQLVIFFLDTRKSSTTERYSSWSESQMRNKSLMYEKSQNVKLEISIWLKKWQNRFFFQKLRVCAKAGDLFSWHIHKVHRGEFFKLFRIRFEKQVFEVRKKWKINV